MNRVFVIAAVLGLEAALLVVLILRLQNLDSRETRRLEIRLPTGRQCSVFLPFGPVSGGGPPLVVLIHGLGVNRHTMVALARALARNGYAAAAVDVSLNPFSTGTSVVREMNIALAALKKLDVVDGSSIALIGHSMGAGAAVALATQRTDVRAVVLVSGGCAWGGARPPNALVILASFDSSQLASACRSALGPTDTARRNFSREASDEEFATNQASELVTVPWATHASVIGSQVTAALTVKWLDRAFGVRRTTSVDVTDAGAPLEWLALITFGTIVLTLALGARWILGLRAESSRRRERS